MWPNQARRGTTLLLAGLIFVLAAFGRATTASAQKVEADYGYFALHATTSSGSTTVSDPTYLAVSYALSLSHCLTADLGYSLYGVESNGLQLGFGPSIGIHYFPFTGTEPQDSTVGDHNWSSAYKWRPFVSLAFQQRQFQSVEAAYAGFALALGTEMQLTPSAYLAGTLSIASMNGPLHSRAQELRATLGVGQLIRGN